VRAVFILGGERKIMEHFMMKNLLRYRFRGLAIGSWNEALVKVESFALRKGANQWLKRSFT
jgi:hypothetical protein